MTTKSTITGLIIFLIAAFILAGLYFNAENKRKQRELTENLYFDLPTGEVKKKSDRDSLAALVKKYNEPMTLQQRNIRLWLDSVNQQINNFFEPIAIYRNTTSNITTLQTWIKDYEYMVNKQNSFIKNFYVELMAYYGDKPPSLLKEDWANWLIHWNKWHESNLKTFIEVLTYLKFCKQHKPELDFENGDTVFKSQKFQNDFVRTTNDLSVKLMDYENQTEIHRDSAVSYYFKVTFDLRAK